jgi:hypothetical protein
MAHTIASDILQYENLLREAGVSEKQAKAHAQGAASLIESNLVTQEYFDHRIELLESRLESRIILKIGAMIATMLTIGLSILGFFLKN